jgi:cytochrome b6-f complex iron-sulfur subunit
LERREFLKKFIDYTFWFFGIGLTSTLVFFYPPEVRENQVQFFPVIEEEKKPKRGVKIANFAYKRKGVEHQTSVFLVASASDANGFIALSPVCTHLGCKVFWNRVDEQFQCPCHGGKYDMYGQVVEGPPPAPLTQLPVKIVDNHINVGLRL